MKRVKIQKQVFLLGLYIGMMLELLALKGLRFMIVQRVKVKNGYGKQKKFVRLHKPLWLPRPNAKYHGCYSVGFEKYLPEWLGTDNYAQLFSGMCKTGFRIDVNPQVKPDLVADVENLELSIPDEHFEATMADPPYNEDFAKRLYNYKYPKWSKWTREMVRITKIGGRIGIMQNYIVPAPKGCVFEDVYCVYGRIKQFPKIITVFRRVR